MPSSNTISVNPCPKIALFGTSADPPSLGHQSIVLELAKRFDRVIIWASDNPFKLDQTPLRQRMEMLHLMVTDLQLHDQQGQYQNIECRPELSHRHSIMSLQIAQQFWETAQFHFVIGSDLVAQFPSWYQANDILKRCHLLVIPRPSYPIQSEDLQRLRELGSVEVADILGLPISSSQFRQTQDRSTISAAIASYIDQHQLYLQNSYHSNLYNPNHPACSVN